MNFSYATDENSSFVLALPRHYLLVRDKGANMKSKTDLSFSELYAVEHAARLARAREVARLIHAGVDALGRFARRAVLALNNRKEISHA
jgi:hypothetical protein